MKLPYRRWIWASCIGCALAVAALSRRSPVPRFQGKSVYDWMLATSSSSLAKNPGLSAIGSNAVPYLARALSTTKTPYERYSFLRQPRIQIPLIRLGVDGRWTKSSLEFRRAAALSLLAYSFEAKPALPQLHAELLRPDAADRRAVISCLLELGPLPESIPFLIQAWPLATNELWVVRNDLMHALGKAGTNAATLALPVALAALDDPRPEVRGAAADALASWGQPAPMAMPKLMSMLSNSDDSLAGAAAAALGRITNRADQAIPALRRLELCTNDYARAVAAITLWRLGGDAEAARRTLESLLASPRAKRVAASHLGNMGSAARPSVPALLRASRENIGAWVDIYDRAQCAQAVLRIQGESAEAAGMLEEALKFEQNSWVRGTVAQELGGLGNLAAPLIPALRRALNDSDREVRYAAAQALARLASTTQP